MAGGGVGFALANIALARVLTPHEFGLLSLILALVQIGLTFGPLGIELAINRHRLDASAPLVACALATSTLTAGALAIVALRFYGIPGNLTICLTVAAVAASLNSVGGALLQAHQRFLQSLFLFQVHNYVLLIAAPLALLLDTQGALVPAALMASAYVLTAAIGFYAGSRLALPGRVQPPLGVVLRESLAGFGIGLAIQLLWQLERVVIPRTLSLDDLATFAAAATIAAAPFRMMQMGTRYTLLPALRSSPDRRSATRVIRKEALAVCAVAAAATIGVFLVTPFIFNTLLQGRYPVSQALITAFIATGLVKVGHGFAATVVQALGTTRMLAKLNGVSWASVVLGVALAYAGSSRGVIGVVVGTGVAWLVMTAAAAAYGLKSLRSWSGPPDHRTPDEQHSGAARSGC
jgi:O-antigen/teichoic acid export membrane protein